MRDPCPAYLTPEVFRSMLADVTKAPDLECAWAGTWDAGKERLTTVRWLSRGTANCVYFATGDAVAGEMLIHSHPGAGRLAPSEPDVQTAAKYAVEGIGSMVVSQNLAWYIVVRAPGPLGGGAWNTRRWEWWRFLVLYKSRRRGLSAPGGQSGSPR